jgi:phosphopantothenoylcysteine decarboxylase/phosphopantothenate--cysteine ligase
MYNHPIVLENIGNLETIGITVLMPRMEEGKAKIPDTDEIVQAVVDELTVKKDLVGMRLLITAGPTRAYLDAFRYITNPSSGKMGVALACNALARGAEVTLVYGPGTAKPPREANIVHVQSTEEMLEVVKQELGSRKHDAAILSAAAADYGPADRKMEKTPSGRGGWVIELKPLPKVVENVKKVDPDIYLIGFKAEYDVTDEELINRAYDRMIGAGMDLIVANDVSGEGVGFGTETNEVFIVDPERRVEHLKANKYEVAAKILDRIREKTVSV